jgi:hypothetical protein
LNHSLLLLVEMHRLLLTSCHWISNILIKLRGIVLTWHHHVVGRRHKSIRFRLECRFLDWLFIRCLRRLRLLFQGYILLIEVKVYQIIFFCRLEIVLVLVCWEKVLKIFEHDSLVSFIFNRHAHWTLKGIVTLGLIEIKEVCVRPLLMLLIFVNVYLIIN